MWINKITNYATKIPELLKLLTSQYQMGFVIGHSHLTDHQISKIRQILYSNNTEGIASDYERQFSSLIGPGFGMSFAAGRMAFFVLLKVLKIGTGDEVILPGFTCSVMVNAVWRTGAIPIFANVDPETFGSCPIGIEKKITNRTKVIVAQHSFGIPCKIKEIVDIAASKGIYVVEDSAITLGSTVDGVVTGNFGHAAIFSTDHSKPINTLIGGFLYSTDKKLLDKVKTKFINLPDLDKEHQKRIFDQILFERKYYNPSYYPRSMLKNYIKQIIKKLQKSKLYSFLEADYNKPKLDHSAYPYPAKLPAFLAQLGLFELERWNKEKERRKAILRRYLDIAEKSAVRNYIPVVYRTNSLDILPLRFVYRHPNPEQHRKIMSKYIDVGWTWFRSPVICCPNGLQDIGYAMGSCSLSEQVCSDIINWPCVVVEGWEKKLFNFFKNVVSHH